MNQWMDPIPAELELLSASLQAPAERQGTLAFLEYDTWESAAYSDKTTPLHKRAVVYTPWDYDGRTPMDVFILMHGGWSNETTILGTPDQPTVFKNAVDHLIESKAMKPMILVCPTYNNLSPEDSADYGLALQLTDRYHQELTNDLMPAIVRNYATYSDGEDAKSLITSRDHWRFGGFSMGSVATWHVFEHALAYFSGFMPLSGNGGQNGQQMAELVRKQGYGPEDFFIFGMTGTKDFAAGAFVQQLQSLVDAWPTFVYTEDGLNGNVALRVQDGCSHDARAMFTYAYNGLKWFGQADEVEDNGGFTPKTTIREVLHDPAFQGFSRLLFPVNAGYMSGDRLENLDLAWYSRVSGDDSARVLNRMKEDVLAGNQIFYNIYTEEEMQNNPALRNTGLFYFRGMENAPFALVSAGGGFAYVAAIHDSFPACQEISATGNNAFAVIYRPGARTACEDLSRALQFIFDHAAELKVDSNGYSLWGGSAGGRMSAWVSEMGTAAFGAKALPKPAADIIQYTGLTEASRNDVPTWMIVGTNDGIANWRTMERRSRALQNLGIDSTIRVVKGLHHGFGIGTGTEAEGWVKEAVDFWLAHRR